MSESRIPWIQAGYQMAAIDGFEKLKIEKLAKLVGKPKSSFYYLFVDLENFVQQMYEFHFQNCQLLAEKEKNASSVDPELVAILVEHRIDLLFNKQLRVIRMNPKIQSLIEQIDSIVLIPFLNIWKQEIQLNLTDIQWHNLFSLALENFYLQIHFANINEIWLRGYFSKLKTTIHGIAGV